ncbi:hypothetical protein RPMA_12610 [Tardiphaga alba]|uniref:Uncharacterized protein n=1 Tax=Tardiphaga alba TaxID=340268 RepID=A0ABX8AB87_9BRAD|nr:hypothetical protein [Tardiphaga alba]QUS39585.1 hypothetical protein RPMA_12610 [Tardiphaga alba]
MQRALLDCDIVEETRVTDCGPGPMYFLKLGSKVIPIGIDHHFAEMLKFALKRNAEAFERPSSTLVGENGQ